MKRLKKITCAALAGVMALSLAIPTFAAAPIPEATENEFEVELTGEYYTPTIRVSVSTESTLYVNPTGGIVSGTVKEAVAGADLNYEFTGTNIISTPIVIRNDTEYNLKVYVEGTATSNGDAVFTASAPGTAKEVQLEIAGQGAGSITSASDKKAAALTGTNKITQADYESLGTRVYFQPVANNAKSATLANTQVAFIAKRASSASTDESQYGVVGLKGAITASSATVEWGEDDTVDASLILTFALA